MEQLKTAGAGLIGQTVKHRAFGSGVIEDLSGNVITVNFKKGDKKFIYPDAFQNFLKLDDAESSAKINSIMDAREKRIQAKKNEIRKTEETKRKIRSMKIVPNSHTVFSMDEEELQESFSRGWAFTGRYMSGFSEGRPRTAGRVKPNSLCLLTTLEPGKPESERKLRGYYMVKEDFYGEKCYDGEIKTHEKYRMLLSPEESFKIWDCVGENEIPKRFGGLHFRYISEDSAKKIITTAKERLAGGRAKLAEEILEYYCKVNRLPYEKK